MIRRTIGIATANKFNCYLNAPISVYHIVTIHFKVK
jgi:hypothetical protein